MDNKKIAKLLFKRLQDEDGDKKRIFPHYEGHFITLVIDELEQLKPTPAEALLAKNKEIKELKNVSKCWELGFIKWKDEYNELKSENTALQSKLDVLIEFSRYIMAQYVWEINDPDALDIQDKAEELGLITSREAMESDIHEESDYEVGDVIYEYTEILTLPEQKSERKEESNKIEGGSPTQ